MIFGPKPQQILQADGNATIALDGHGPTTVYTKAFRLVQGTQFSLWLKAAGSSPRMDITLEQSYKEPTTEGAVDADWVTPEGNSPIVNDLSDTNAHIVANLAPAVMPWGRLKLVSNASNGADTTLQAVLGVQSER